jgi:hypothetical protein
LHRGKVDKYDPEDIVSNDRQLATVANSQKRSHNSPEAKKKRNHREFDIQVWDGVENQMIKIQKKKDFLESDQAK